MASPPRCFKCFTRFRCFKCSQREKVFVLVFVHRGVSGVSDGVETSDPSLQGGSGVGYFPWMARGRATALSFKMP